MPALVRKLFIVASVNGLIVQAHGPVEHHKAIRLQYKTNKVENYASGDISAADKQDGLEAHALIGLLSLASQSFLIAVTRREQVAQIFGKPVYVITDVAFLPLISRAEAVKAIRAAEEARKLGESTEDGDLSDLDVEEHQSPEKADVSSSPTDDEGQSAQKAPASTSIARDVYTKRGQFGRFASNWLSRRGWPTAQSAGGGGETDKPGSIERSGPAERDTVSITAATSGEQSSPAAEVKTDTMETTRSATTVDTMLPKVLRSSRLILCSRSFFYSYEYNLFRRLGVDQKGAETPVGSRLDPLYFWNAGLAAPILEGTYIPFVVPILQGFVGQRAFLVKKPNSNQPESGFTVPTENPSRENVSNAVSQVQNAVAEITENSQPFLLTLISRRSVKRSGLRYLRRGIDDEGNCANTVETEQILSAPDWSNSRVIRSFTQIRASIPIFFSQSPYSFKPIPQFHQSQQANDAAFKRHFSGLKDRYGDVQIDLLVDKHGTEVAIGRAYEETYGRLAGGENSPMKGVDFEWFDFHAECRGMKFENVSKLVDKFKENLDRYGETLLSNDEITNTQKGIVRTNCMDCLDRTNVVESALGQYMLSSALTKEGFNIDLVGDQSTTWFNTLWADNGDAISRQYAGTAALKGDFTRTRKRNMQGAMFDFSLTLTRYYNNMINDYFSQAVIDVLLGNLSWKIFEEFESNMMSADPGISISKIRDNAVEICRRLVIQDDTEDTIYGWTMLAPAHENSIRTLPFQETVVLLTDAALYCVKFDWTTEKVASFEKVDLRSISKIRYGTYISSTLSERESDEKLNAGLVVIYTPGKESVIRTNTRSLQNYVEPGANQDNRIDGGTGVLSWLAPRSPPTSRVMALKVIPQTGEGEEPRQDAPSVPLAAAKDICYNIERAMTGPKEEGAAGVKDLIEEGDIISLAEAKKRTGYLEQIGHSIKKFVWT